METAAQHKSHSAPIADRFAERRDEIARLCEMRIRERVPSARAHSDPVLLDHIPQILDSMIERLRGETPKARQNADEKKVSRVHGSQRAGLESYTFENILAEYRVLRQSIFDVLERHGAPVMGEERDAILDAVQLGAKYAAAQFVHDRTIRTNFFHWHATSRWSRYLISIGIVSVSAAVQWQLRDFLHGTPFICFYPAVVLSSLFGDGLIAAALSALLAQYLFVPPYWSLRFVWPEDYVHMALFLFNAFLIALVTKSMRSSMQRAETLTADQAEARRDLEESETRFRELADSIPQMAWIAAPDGQIHWFNRRWYDFTGLRQEDMTEFAWLPKVHDADFVKTSHPRYEEHIRSGTAWEDTIPLKSKDGTWHWFLSRARPIRDSNGKILRWFGTNTDITELREARNEVNEAKERYELALTSGKIGVWEMDLKSSEIKVKWSPRQYEIFDVDQDGKPLTYDIFTERVHPADLAAVNAEFENATKEKRDFHIQFRVVWRNGSVHWVRGDGRVYYGVDGTAVRMVGTNIEVTDRVLADEALRKSAAEFRALADSMPQIVWIAGDDGHVEYFNRRFFEYTGLSKAEAYGPGWEKAVHPDDIERLRACWHESQETKAPFELEYRMRRYDGEFRWHLGRGVPILGEHGRLTRWYGTNTEIQDYKMLITKLEEEQRVRERFTNMLSHDLKNPLNAAKISAQIALRKKTEVAGHEKAFTRIVESVNRADRMISDLLDANRIKAGERLPLPIASVDLSKLLREVIEGETLAHGDRFHLDCAGAVEGFWNAEGLHRVFENLLGNAVKYGTPDTPITVRLQEAGTLVNVAVHNEGNELTPEESAKLFTMFRRAKQAEKSAKLGWGIGLTLVKGFVEAHGGRTWVESGAGKGTTFYVELPRDSRPFGD